VIILAHKIGELGAVGQVQPPRARKKMGTEFMEVSCKCTPRSKMPAIFLLGGGGRGV